MIATHRVKDSTDKTVGFIIDNHFYTDYDVKENISLVENVEILDDGVLSVKKEIPVVGYKQAVILPKYRTIVEENPFDRDIQGQLEKWRKRSDHKVLQVEGTRQIGKTTELKKFAYKNYEYVMKKYMVM